MVESVRIVEPIKPLAVPIASLNPDPANARKHGPKNLDAIKASLAKFGQRKPIVVQRAGMVVRAGNGTLAAAKALGWAEIAAVVIDDDNATAAQFAIADNRSAELAEWDEDILAFELERFPDIAELLHFELPESVDGSGEDDGVETFDVREPVSTWIVAACSDHKIADEAIAYLETLGLRVSKSVRR